MSAQRCRLKDESETLLEHLLDTLSNIPNSLKRNLEHIADLDSQSTAIGKRLKGTEDALLTSVHGNVCDYPFPAGVTIPTTKELTKAVVDEGELTAIEGLRKRHAAICKEKLETSLQSLSGLNEHITRIDSTLDQFETYLRETGFFENKGAKPGDQVAIQLDEGGGGEWVLGRVVQYNAEAGMYKILDEDADTANIKTYQLQESAVMQLGAVDPRKGEMLYCVYPDTTSFYPATVVTVRKAQSGAVVYVQFADDADEFGVVHDKPVLLRHTFKI